jgi:ubiquinone/menaquinone biosynthesis C-methylase UbiE
VLKVFHKLIQRRHFADGDAYDRHASGLFGGIYAQVADDVATAAPRGGIVFDGGCGTGQLAVHIAHRRPDLYVYGVDLSSGMIEVAERRAKQDGVADRVQFAVADLAALPLREDCVDLVVSTASLHHWTDPGAVVATLNRILRPRGRILLYDLRWVHTSTVRSAARKQQSQVDRLLIRTGPFPIALFQRLAIEPGPQQAAL